MIRRIKKQAILPKSKTDRLIEDLRKDLAMLIIETEGLVAVVVERAKFRTGGATKGSRKRGRPRR